MTKAYGVCCCVADFEDGDNYDDDNEEGGDESGSYNPQLTSSDDPADYMTEVDGVWFCTICQKRSSNRPNCKRHVEFCHFHKYEGARCQVCHKLFRRKQELRTHYRLKHLAA